MKIAITKCALLLIAVAPKWQPSTDGREMDFYVVKGHRFALCGFVTNAEMDNGIYIRGEFEAYGLGSGGAKTTGLLGSSNNAQDVKKLVEKACQ